MKRIGAHDRLWGVATGVGPLGAAGEVQAERARTLDAPYTANPDRFRRRPTPPKLPTEAWINDPSREALILSMASGICPEADSGSARRLPSELPSGGQ
jgi:putative transposase